MLAPLILLITSLAIAGEPSVYEIKSPWTQQDGRTISLRELSGQPVLVTMVYTGCAHTCPLTVKKLQAIAQLAEVKGLGTFRIALASFDTEGDRSVDLARYMKKNKLDPQRWTLISSASDTTVRELAVVLGISYKKLAKGNFSHSNVIALLDSDGAVLYRLEGLAADPTPLFNAWKKNSPSTASAL